MRVLILLAASLAATPLPAEELPRFQAAGKEFAFDTGVLRGKLRARGKSFGLIPVTHAATGAEVSRSMGLLGLYRVFSDGKRYGAGAWDYPGQAALEADGAVRVQCAAAADRPFDLAGLYRWRGPATLDLEVAVTPKQDLKGFEVFAASYFSSAFSEAAASVLRRPSARPDPRANPSPAPDPRGFLRAQRRLGEWLMFPRDPQAVPLIQDGRWKLPPHPVDWTIQEELHRPIAYRRAPAPGLTAVLLAAREDCFAIALPYETEPHYSVYLSLFGRDLKAGERAAARVRLQFLEKPDDAALHAAHQALLAGR